MYQLLKISEQLCNEDHKISVICCARDAEKYLHECIKSMIEQKMHSFRIMFLDDCSSDSTCDFAIEMLSKSCVPYQVFKSCINLGVPKARNSLIKKCSSPLIAIHDADDIMMPYRLAMQYSFMDQHNEVSALGGKAIKIDNDSKFIGTMPYPPSNHDDILFMLPGKVNPMIDPTMMMRTSVFNSMGGYSEIEEARLAQDFDLWIRMAKSGFKMANLDIPLIAYRSSDSGLTVTRKNDMIKSHVYVQSSHRQFLDKIRRLHVKT